MNTQKTKTLKKFTFLNVSGCVYYRHQHIVCETCFQDLQKTLNFKELKPRPLRWRKPKYPGLDGFNMLPYTEMEKLDHISLYLESISWKYSWQTCDICEKARTSPNHTSRFTTLNTLRAEIETQLIMYNLYKKLVKTISKKETIKIIDAVNHKPYSTYHYNNS